jgi:hypothetical protein
VRTLQPLTDSARFRAFASAATPSFQRVCDVVVVTHHVDRLRDERAVAAAKFIIDA